jgi:hypothetical protein
MRLGGIGDKTEPYYNRCIFAGADGFESGDLDGGDGGGGNNGVRGRVEDDGIGKQRRRGEVSEDGFLRGMRMDERQSCAREEHVSRHRSGEQGDHSRAKRETSTSRVDKPDYASDLDAYLRKTYGKNEG